MNLIQHYNMPAPVILIVDDHPVVADSVAAIVTSLFGSLSDQIRIEVTHSMRSAVSVIEQEPTLFGIVTDLSLPDSKGIGTVERLVASLASKPRNDGVKPTIIVFSGVEHALLKQHCLAIGAAAFITKNENVKALKQALAGMFEPVVKALHAGLTTQKPAAAAPSIAELLTKKQAAILQDLAAGYSNAEIAQRHGVGINTIKTHVKDIFDRIGARNRTEAAKLFFGQNKLPAAADDLR